MLSFSHMASGKEKPIAIIIYGMIAVGKLTVAKALQKELGFKLTHNHLINDLVWSVFDRNTFEANDLIEKMRFQVYEEAIRHNVNIIVTHCYSHDYVSPTGLSDPEYLRQLEEKLEAVGARTLFVHLQADRETLLKRVDGESRHQYKKLTSIEKMIEYLDEKFFDLNTSAPVRNNHVIDNTNMAPEDVAASIAEKVRQLS